MIALYPWQHDDFKAVQAHFERLPNAFLIQGAAGTGKHHFAAFLRQALLCEQGLLEQRPCGVCTSCLFNARNEHPDTLTLAPDEVDDDAPTRSLPLIKIEAVRQALSMLHLKPHQYKPHSLKQQVITVTAADLLNLNAANALLKALEEPSDDVIFLLITVIVYWQK
jgi:DNA polymerase-3 subunit delta'